VERARAERDAAIEARDRAQDLADELSEAAGALPDDRVLALRSELRGLRATVDQLSSGLDELRSVAKGAGDGRDQPRAGGAGRRADRGAQGRGGGAWAASCRT
jgi:outer membrane murein-binding lipoprotein Lpp